LLAVAAIGDDDYFCIRPLAQPCRDRSCLAWRTIR
jgi:hypothetical protein